MKAGIYRHYKGHLYLVQGVAHDANAEDLAHKVDGPGNGWLWAPMEEREVVVYVGLTLDGANLGPRMAVRTRSDFEAVLCEACYEPADRCIAAARHRDAGMVKRFTYLGEHLTAEML